MYDYTVKNDDQGMTSHRNINGAYRRLGWLMNRGYSPVEINGCGRTVVVKGLADMPGGSATLYRLLTMPEAK